LKRIVIGIVLLVGLAAVSHADNYAYVLNGISETLSRINLETGAVDNHVVTVGVIPNQVVYHDGLLYVVNSGAPSLQVIDPETNGVIDEIPLPLNSNPWNAAFSAGFAYVTGFATSRLYKVDLNAGSVVGTFVTGQSPEGVAYYSGRLFVANTGFNPVDFSYGQGSVSILDPSDGHQVAQPDVGKNPQAMAVGPDGIISVICTGDYDTVTGMIYFLDPVANTVIDSIATGGNPYLPAINAAGIGFVSAGGWTDAGQVYSYDAVSRVVFRGSSDPILVGTGAMGMALDSVGFIYSTGQITNSVSKFDHTGVIHGTYNVGAGPASITLIDSRTSVEGGDSPVPQTLQLGLPYPNPFNSAVTIPVRGGLGPDFSGELLIFDSVGRLVTVLSTGGKSASGRNFAQDYPLNSLIVWDGTTAQGALAVSGVYFVRLAGTRGSAKVVLLK